MESTRTRAVQILVRPPTEHLKNEFDALARSHGRSTNNEMIVAMQLWLNVCNNQQALREGGVSLEHLIDRAGCINGNVII